MQESSKKKSRGVSFDAGVAHSTDLPNQDAIANPLRSADKTSSGAALEAR